MSYICQCCNNRVDTDLDEFTEEAINNTLCQKCQDSDNAQQWHDNNPVEADL